MNSLPRHKKWPKCCRGNKSCQNEFSAAAEKCVKSLPRQRVICPGSCYEPGRLLFPLTLCRGHVYALFSRLVGQPGLKVRALVRLPRLGWVTGTKCPYQRYMGPAPCLAIVSCPRSYIGWRFTGALWFPLVSNTRCHDGLLYPGFSSGRERSDSIQSLLLG